MKIAICKEETMVAPHFGRCPEYAIADIDKGQATDIVILPNPGHEPGFLPGYLARKGVKCVIAGGMGPRAQALFAAEGIETIVGVSCSVDEALKEYMKGTLTGGDSMCDHGSHEHLCEN